MPSVSKSLAIAFYTDMRYLLLAWFLLSSVKACIIGGNADGWEHPAPNMYTARIEKSVLPPKATEVVEPDLPVWEPPLVEEDAGGTDGLGSSTKKGALIGTLLTSLLVFIRWRLRKRLGARHRRD